MTNRMALIIAFGIVAMWLVLIAMGIAIVVLDDYLLNTGF